MFFSSLPLALARTTFIFLLLLRLKSAVKEQYYSSIDIRQENKEGKMNGFFTTLLNDNCRR